MAAQQKAICPTCGKLVTTERTKAWAPMEYSLHKDRDLRDCPSTWKKVS